MSFYCYTESSELLPEAAPTLLAGLLPHKTRHTSQTKGAIVKRNQRTFRQPADTPATRKRRLQARLQEISDKSEQELAALMKSFDKVKSTLKPPR